MWENGTRRQEIDILYKKRDKWHPLAVCVFAASLSIAGTFFALQTGYDRGKQIDDIQIQIMKQLALSEGVITEYQLNNEEAREQAKMKKMLSNHYLSKGEGFLAKADSLLGSNAKELDYLKNNIENKTPNKKKFFDINWFDQINYRKHRRRVKPHQILLKIT